VKHPSNDELSAIERCVNMRAVGACQLIVWGVAGALASGCRHASVAGEPPARPLTIVYVCPEPYASADWPAIRWPDALFSVANERGYLATVRIGRDRHECDHCPGPGVSVAFVHGRSWPDLGGGPVVGQVCHPAVGPVTGPLVRQRVLKSAPAALRYHATSGWEEWLQIDLDGDGRADLAGVERCDRVTPSGCHDHLCDRRCQGVRKAGAPDAPVTWVKCEGFLPDVADCEPGKP